jgi:hypothetical protein
MPDILHVCEHFVGKSQRDIKHPAARDNCYRADGDELWDNRQCHVADGCYRLKERDSDTDDDAGQ